MLVDFFDKMQLDLFIHPVLQQKLVAGIEQNDFELASQIMSAYIDSWPVAGSIVMAWKHWNENCDPLALSLLTRANEIIELLGAPKEEIPLPKELPSYIEMEGADLLARRREICRQAALGEIVAVHFSSPVPNDAASQLALGELRMEAAGQRAVEQYGLPGLLAPATPSWANALGRAPKGHKGDSLQMVCDLLILPGTPSRIRKGDTSPVGWLLWKGPAKPLPIMPEAIALMRNISSGISQACQIAKLEEDRGRQIIDELIEIGALSAIGKK